MVGKSGLHGRSSALELPDGVIRENIEHCEGPPLAEVAGPIAEELLINNPRRYQQGLGRVFK